MSAEKELIIKLRLDRDDAKQAEAEERAGLKQMVEDVYTAERAKQGAVRRTGEEHGETASKAKRAGATITSTWKDSTDSIMSATSGLRSFAGAMIGLGGLTAIVQEFEKHFKAIGEMARQAAASITKMREDLAELSSLKGQAGDSGKTIAEELQFRSKTLQTASESNAFQQAMRGVGSSSIGVNISEEEFKKLMVGAGKFQAVKGGSAETHGKLAGMLPTLMGGKVTAEQAIGEEQAMFDIFEPGGGSFTQLTDQYLKNAGLVTSGMTSHRKLAGLTSAFSLTNPGGADTNVQQFARGTVGALGRMRGSGVEGSETQAKYLRGLGATDQMDMIDIGTKISDDLANQEQAAAARGQKFNALGYLQKHGYQNQEDANALMTFHGLRKTGQWQGKFMPLIEKQVDPAGVTKDLDEAQATDPRFTKRAADLEKDIADVQLGTGQESVENLRKAAFERLRAKKEVTGTYEDTADNTDWSGDELIFGQKRKTEAEAEKMMQEEAERVGVDMDKTYKGVVDKKGVYHTPGSEGYLPELQRQTVEKGGQAVPGTSGQADAAAMQLEAAKMNLKAAKRNQGRQGQPHGGVPDKIESKPQVQM